MNKDIYILIIIDQLINLLILKKAADDDGPRFQAIALIVIFG